MKRPLSPHLQVYKPQITSILSITHRATGVFLTLGIAGMVCWLFALSQGPESYQVIYKAIHTYYGLAIVSLWSLALYYHFCNGIRHLFWDIGVGMTNESVATSGRSVIYITLILWIATWTHILRDASQPYIQF